MGLSCSCSEWDGEGWGYEVPDDFTIYKNERSCKCKSCGKKILSGNQVVKFTKFRGPHDAIEDKIYGEDGRVALASWYFCEKCGEIYLNLESLGFCVDIEEDMDYTLKEYQDDYSDPAWESFKNYDFKR